MDEQRTTDPRLRGVWLVASLAAVMWVVEIIDSLDHHRLDTWGIQPRDADGLRGVVAAPFLHASFGHLLGNTIPFLIFGAVIAIGGLARVVSVTAIVGLVSGLGTWLIAPSHTLHIGASGIVFGYAAYLISRGVFSGRMLQLAVGAVVGVFWGAGLIGGVIPQDGISWQAHVFGLAGGVLAAYVLRPEKKADAPSVPGLDRITS
jgi:membrane associated rhomboid family serine protease